MQAAKAARGRARQHRAEKHTSRLAHQREKAAQALAVLQARHPVPIGTDIAGSDEHDSGSAVVADASDSVTENAADAVQVFEASFSMAENNTESFGEGVQEPSEQQDYADDTQSRATTDLSHGQSLPVMIPSSTSCSVSAEGDTCAESHLCFLSRVRSTPLRCHASAAGSPNLSRFVPSPVAAHCSSQSSPNSMTSWQIVRPRPVQRDSSAFRASPHVPAQA